MSLAKQRKTLFRISTKYINFSLWSTLFCLFNNFAQQRAIVLVLSACHFRPNECYMLYTLISTRNMSSLCELCWRLWLKFLPQSASVFIWAMWYFKHDLSKHPAHPRSHPPPYWQIFRSLPLTPQTPIPTNKELYSSRPDGLVQKI
jgi:hypothetical protein